MDTLILLSELNDFIFCPRSIYFHHIYGKYKKSLYQTTVQEAGTKAHETIDSATYSSRKDILQGISVHSSKYGIAGKIDIFDIKRGILTERKKKTLQVKQGHIWQITGQYLCLVEMGYTVKSLRIYSMDTNKNFPIPLPDTAKIEEFKLFLDSIRQYRLDGNFEPNAAKCKNCIYSPLCDKAIITEGCQTDQYDDLYF